MSLSLRTKKPHYLFSEAFLFMAYYVYILESDINGDYYKGVTENVELWLFQHNDGQKVDFTALLL
ncbi:MAG: hypothetical protein V4561_12480 [Bacteroidota bacterium]